MYFILYSQNKLWKQTGAISTTVLERETLLSEMLYQYNLILLVSKATLLPP